MLDEHFGSSIDRTRCFIEDENCGFSKERASDREQLLLASTEIARFVVKDGVVAIGHCSHEVIDMCCLGRLDDFLISCIKTSVRNVVADRSAEKPGVLQHHAHA